MASQYRGVADRLSSFRSKVKTSDGEILHYNVIDTKANPGLLGTSRAIRGDSAGRAGNRRDGQADPGVTCPCRRIHPEGIG
jgi:hypothetical protein